MLGPWGRASRAYRVHGFVPVLQNADARCIALDNAQSKLRYD